MRVRFWIGLLAVLLVGAGSVAAALVFHAENHADFHRAQSDAAVRAAHQAEAVAALSVGQLSSASAFIRADGDLSRHEFEVIAEPLLRGGALSAAAFIQRVPGEQRAAYQRLHRAPIFERRGPDGGFSPAERRSDYYPLTYAVNGIGAGPPVGYDVAVDPGRGPFLRRARDRGEAVATPPVSLLIGGYGINIYRPVYRDGAPTRTVAQRRRALVGFVAGAFRLRDLAAAAISTVSEETEVQLRVDGEPVLGPDGELPDADGAQIQVADRTWVLIVRDPNRPDVSLPILLAAAGIALAALLGSLILLWSRDERMRVLTREAGEDSLTGLKNRRRFEEDLKLAMARARRERATGALLMLDLDHFKQVNDGHGHPAGDRLIEEVAGVLRQRARESDVLARLGGDEFAIVLPRSTLGEAHLTAEAIAEAIREYEPRHEGVESVTASIGVAMFGDDPRTSVESVVSEADTAMYAAKDGGRDGVRIFDPQVVREDAAG